MGLGLMGSGIVSNLLKMGHVVTVWNRTAEKVPSSSDALFCVCLMKTAANVTETSIEQPFFCSTVALDLICSG